MRLSPPTHIMVLSKIFKQALVFPGNGEYTKHKIYWYLHTSQLLCGLVCEIHWRLYLWITPLDYITGFTSLDYITGLHHWITSLDYITGLHARVMAINFL